jgi:recombination protein RecR
MNDHLESTECRICASLSREKGELMIVAKDVDLENIEKSGSYHGYYFVLGSTISILKKDSEKKVRSQELLDVIEKRLKDGLQEIILALSTNTEGEHTAQYIRSLVSPVCLKNNIKISTLGRGLSTGAELEYSDGETLKNALKNRA